MKNTFAINDVCHQIIKACESMIELGHGIEQFEQNNSVELVGVYNDMRLDHLEHVQNLALNLTDLVTQTVAEDKPAEVNADEAGSVFGAGDLNAVKAEPIEPNEPADENRGEEE